VTSPRNGAPAAAYEGAGRQAAVAVRGFSSVIVASDDVIAAAHTAIGIALAESAHRLVMIGDLAGEVAPLQALVPDDDSHGISDSFEFGTSFVRVAREVEGAQNIFILPSGTESAATEKVLASPRWQAFASEFAKADELLILVTAANTPGIARLVTQVDGVVLVGIRRLDAAPDANILARIPHPAVVPPPRIALPPRREPSSPARIGLAAAGLLLAGIAGGMLLGSRSSDETDRPAIAPPGADSSVADSLRKDATAVMPSNPQDSLLATPFSVEILAANTAEGANFEIQRHGSAMPAATISIVPIGDTESTWYKVYAGVYEDSAQAERLLASLRRRRVVPDSAGTVVRAPLALLVDSVPAQAGVSARTREKIQQLADRGIHAYGLVQADGSVRVYSGAFQRPEQSPLAATALRVAGLTPVLAYRTGSLR